jgi:hypothetical protein
MKRLAALLATCLLAIPGIAAELESFTPLGEHLEALQARARFSAPMAPLGRADAPAPFQVACAAPGNGYWADERT